MEIYKAVFFFFQETLKQKKRKGLSSRDSTDSAHIWHLFPSATLPKHFQGYRGDWNFGAMCLSSTGLLKQEGREKQIMNVNAQKHKASSVAITTRCLAQLTV